MEHICVRQGRNVTWPGIEGKIPQCTVFSLEHTMYSLQDTVCIGLYCINLSVQSVMYSVDYRV